MSLNPIETIYETRDERSTIPLELKPSETYDELKRLEEAKPREVDDDVAAWRDDLLKQLTLVTATVVKQDAEIKSLRKEQDTLRDALSKILEIVSTSQDEVRALSAMMSSNNERKPTTDKNTSQNNRQEDNEYLDDSYISEPNVRSNSTPPRTKSSEEYQDASEAELVSRFMDFLVKKDDYDGTVTERVDLFTVKRTTKLKYGGVWSPQHRRFKAPGTYLKRIRTKFHSEAPRVNIDLETGNDSKM